MKTKEKPTITYIKNGKEVTKYLNIFNRYKTILTLFEQPFSQINKLDFYSVKEDIQLLHLKNVTFYQDMRFICPKDTILILENCNFKRNNLSFLGGSVEIIHPDLSREYWKNNIHAQHMENFSISLKDNSNTPLRLSITSKKISITDQQNIRNLYLKGQEIILQNITKLKSMSVTGKNVKIINSNITIDEIEESQEKKNTHIKCETLELQKTTLESYSSLILELKKITLDQESKLQSTYDIIVGTNIYKNMKILRAKLTLNSNYLLNESQNMTSRRKLISFLKGIKEVAQQEIEIQGKKRETELCENLSPKEKQIYKLKIKQKVNQYKEGVHSHKSIGQYQAFK